MGSCTAASDHDPQHLFIPVLVQRITNPVEEAATSFPLLLGNSGRAVFFAAFMNN